jgi:hypothetical protein
MALPGTPEAFGVWLEAQRELDDTIARVLRAQHEILRALGVPDDLVNDEIALWDILTGKRPFVWKKTRGKKAARGRDPVRTHKARLWNACRTMVLLKQARQRLVHADVDALNAAREFLEAGLHAADSEYVVRAAEKSRHDRTKGGQTTGAQRRAAADARDADLGVDRHVKSYFTSDELADQYRTPAAYLSKETGLNPRTARRRVKKIARSKAGQ